MKISIEKKMVELRVKDKKTQMENKLSVFFQV